MARFSRWFAGHFDSQAHGYSSKWYSWTSRYIYWTFEPNPWFEQHNTVRKVYSIQVPGAREYNDAFRHVRGIFVSSS